MVIRVNIFQTESLTQNNGKFPQDVIREYLSAAFERTDYEHDVRTGFNSISVSTENPLCDDGSAYYQWKDIVNYGDVPTAKDCNILLTDNEGSGCGSVGGNTTTAGVNRIEEYIKYKESGSGDVYDDIETAIHEVAHNLGFSHDGDEDIAGHQHLGTAWNNPVTIFGIDFGALFGGTWHRTPCVTDTDVENLCGEYIPEQRFNSTVHEMYFHTCAVDNFDIV